jgi:hypothetical protein
MKASTVNAFRKTRACPSSNMLLAFNAQTLSEEVSTLVSSHLDECDFCDAEVNLLGHLQLPVGRARKAPELPINLRILAESILAQSKRARKRATPVYGLHLSD